MFELMPQTRFDLVSDYERPECVRRLCDVNNSYFSRVGRPQAYWLGFLLADGCVSLKSRGRTTQFELKAASKDEEHLYKLKHALSSTYQISGPNEGVWQLVVNDYDLCLSVERYGVVPRKSITAMPPDLPEELWWHWFRGLVDGDGSFGSYYRPNRAKKFNGLGRPITCGRWVLMLSVTGSSSVTAYLQHRLSGSRRRRGNVWTWAINDQRAARIIGRMYKRSTVETRLNRKYDRAVELGLLA